MRVKIITMLKDEDDLVLLWLKYHISIVGAENLIVYDNGSRSRPTIDALASAEKQGVEVIRSESTIEAFVNRGSTYEKRIAVGDAAAEADFWMPVDCDEFLAVWQDESKIRMSRMALQEELQRYLGYENPLMIYAGLDNQPRKPGCFSWAVDQKKTYFAAGACKELGHGFHSATSKKGGERIRTNIVYVHYHFKPYDLLVRHAKEKLRPFTDDFSRESMNAYILNRRPAYHCAGHLLINEKEYYERCEAKNYREFPEVKDVFQALGEVLPFSKA